MGNKVQEENDVTYHVDLSNEKKIKKKINQVIVVIHISAATQPCITLLGPAWLSGQS